MRVFALIPAGGRGTRAGSTVPKQYCKINGRELIVYTLEIFQQNKLIDEIVVSADPLYFKLLKRLISKYNLTKVSLITAGGKTRQDSVFSGLSSIYHPNLNPNLNLNPNPNLTLSPSLPAKSTDLAVVHDAARALLPQEVLTDAILTAKKRGNALVCIRAKDTLIRGNKFVQSYLEREEIYYVQTPQIFRCGDLMKSMKKAYEDKFTGTDESMLIKRTGKKVNVVEGSALNFKITTKEDMEIFRKVVRSES